MSTARIYRLALVALAALLFAVSLRSQTCEPNMLFIQDSTGYAYVPKFSASKLGSSFTIEFWVQSLNMQNGKGILEIGRTGDTGSIRFEIDNSSQFRASAAFTGGTTNLSVSASSQLYWNHIALTLSATDTLKLYLNGTLVANAKVASHTLRTLGDTLFIGKSSLTGRSLYGNIEEVRMWNHERTRNEINTNKSQVMPDSAAGLIAYYRMDDRTGQQKIHDFTGKGNKGIIVFNAITTTSTAPVTGQDHPGYMLSSLEKFVDMGIISCGGSKDTIVHITNLGSDTLGIEALGFTNGPVFSINTSSGFPLPPVKDRFAIVKLQADAKGIGIFYDTLVIISSTECGGSVRIVFKIQVDSAGIRFSEPTLKIKDENIVSCLLPFNYSLTLENTGSSDITIISKKFFGNAGIEYISPPLPFTIKKDTSKQIIIRILPGGAGYFSTQFSVTTKECSKVAEIFIEGERTEVKFDMPSQVTLPDQYYIAGGFVDTNINFINTGSSDIFIQDVIIQNQPGSTTFRKISPANGEYLYPGDTLKTIIRT
ncbi:MAG TPA: LamG domain-containing protein, partial [Candidatus Kapabacteria bacterium]